MKNDDNTSISFLPLNTFTLLLLSRKHTNELFNSLFYVNLLLPLQPSMAKDSTVPKQETSVTPLQLRNVKTLTNIKEEMSSLFSKSQLKMKKERG